MRGICWILFTVLQLPVFRCGMKVSNIKYAAAYRTRGHYRNKQNYRIYKNISKIEILRIGYFRVATLSQIRTGCIAGRRVQWAATRKLKGSLWLREWLALNSNLYVVGFKILPILARVDQISILKKRWTQFRAGTR